MSKNTRAGATAAFAHLLGLGPRAEKDDDEKKGKKARRAEDDDDAKKGARRAEDDDKDERAEEDKDEKEERAEEEREEEDEEEDRDGKKGKKAKKAKRAEEEEDEEEAEDDDSDEEMRGNSAAANARRRERARCKAIFSCAAAGVRPDVAASLAFSTTMSRSEAIAVLTTTAAGSAPRGSRLNDRMNGVRVASAGADDALTAPSGMSPVAAAIVAAGEKARGETGRAK